MFGGARLGLQTGDASLNPDAQVVVMTTEILRNIMYRPPEVDGSSATEARLGDVGLIVLDEVHYLGDPHRGSVWEEVIINCPRHIRMLCMSATVKNPRDVGEWIQQVRTTGKASHCTFHLAPSAHTQTHTETRAHKRGHTHTHTHTHTCARTNKHTYASAQTDARALFSVCASLYFGHD
jgi:superfamily II RNA helicase